MGKWRASLRLARSSASRAAAPGKRRAGSFSSALPTITFDPDRSNHRVNDLPKRKLAVAVTASTA